MSADMPKPFGYWHEGQTYEESDFFLASEFGNVGCDRCTVLYTAEDLEQAVQEAARQAMEQRDHLQLLFNASKLGHEQMYAQCGIYAALLRRADQQLMAWAKKYGEHNPQWLPPAGDVQLSEDINAALGQSPDPLIHQSEKRHG